MNEGSTADAGWFEGLDRGDLDGGSEAIEGGSAESPSNWPERAVEAGFAESEDDYYRALHGTTMRATREAVTERERADDLPRDVDLGPEVPDHRLCRMDPRRARGPVALDGW